MQPHRRAGLLAAGFALLALPATAQQAVTLPETDVTASPLGAAGGSFAPVTTVDGPTLNATGAASLGDALRDQPGISATTFAPGASRPVIRGLDNYRVRIQQDGLAAGDASAFGEDHGVPLDPLSASRVEVIRGPAALRWGGQAIGGVVNVISDRIATELPQRAVSGRALGQYDTGLNGWGGSLGATVAAGGFVLNGDMSGRYTNDYRIPGGRGQANSGVRSDSFGLGLSYIFDQGYIGTSVSQYRSLYGIPGGESAALGTSIDMEQFRWSSQGEYRPAGGFISAINFRLGYTRYSHNEIGLEEHDHEEGDDHGPLSRVVHGGFRSQGWDGRLELRHVPVSTPLGELTGAFGLSYEREALRTTGEALEFLPPNSTDRYAAYLFEELALRPGTRVQAAARIEGVRVGGSTAAFPTGYLPAGEELANVARSRSFLPVSLSLGVLQDLPRDLQLRLTGQYSQRAPSAAELFSRGSHHASGTFDIGNPNLGMESALSVELGLARRVGAWRFDASTFFSHYNNFIYRGLTGNTCGHEFDSCVAAPGGEFQQTVYGQRDARFYGLELTGEVDLYRAGQGVAGISGRYDFVRAEFTGGGNVPRIPPHRLGAGAYWRSPSWNAAVDYIHAFDQNRFGANDTATRGYDSLDARLGYSLPVADGRQITLSVIGRNLLDADMRNAVSFKRNEVLLPGRRVIFQVAASF